MFKCIQCSPCTRRVLSSDSFFIHAEQEFGFLTTDFHQQECTSEVQKKNLMISLMHLTNVCEGWLCASNLTAEAEVLHHENMAGTSFSSFMKHCYIQDFWLLFDNNKTQDLLSLLSVSWHYHWIWYMSVCDSHHTKQRWWPGLILTHKIWQTQYCVWWDCHLHWAGTLIFDKGLSSTRMHNWSWEEESCYFLDAPNQCLPGLVKCIKPDCSGQMQFFWVDKWLQFLIKPNVVTYLWCSWLSLITESSSGVQQLTDCSYCGNLDCKKLKNSTMLSHLLQTQDLWRM